MKLTKKQIKEIEELLDLSYGPSSTQRPGYQFYTNIDGFQLFPALLISKTNGIQTIPDIYELPIDMLILLAEILEGGQNEQTK